MIITRHSQDLERRHRKVAAWLGAIVLSMTALSFAAVPLYRIFCQVTGYGGTTQRVAQGSAVTLDRTITIRFDANVGPGLPWDFEPMQRTMTVKIGENALAFYRATNRADHDVKGTAAFNVLPELTGAYFNKVACFCFTEQTLKAGESVEMPVSFYVDPALVDDKDTKSTREITLSYTFYRVDNGKPAVAGTVKGAGRSGT